MIASILKALKDADMIRNRIIGIYYLIVDYWAEKYFITIAGRIK